MVVWRMGTGRIAAIRWPGQSLLWPQGIRNHSKEELQTLSNAAYGVSVTNNYFGHCEVSTFNFGPRDMTRHKSCISRKTESTKWRSFTSKADTKMDEETEHVDLEEDTDVDAGTLRSHCVVKEGSKGLLSLWSRTEMLDKKTSLVTTLKSWIAEGNLFTRDAYLEIIGRLHFRTRYKQALEILEWVQQENMLTSEGSDYLYHIDLVARARGILQAEKLIESLPPEQKTEKAYNALMLNCVARSNLSKAKSVLCILKENKLITGPFVFNQLMLLLRRKGMEDKILEVFADLESCGIAPDIHTYLTLMRGNMASITDNMRTDMEAVLKGTEAQTQKSDWRVHEILLRLYALLGRKEDVERIWSIVSENAFIPKSSYICMVEVLGMLSAYDRAEEVFKEMEEKRGIDVTRQFSCIVGVYARKGDMGKAEEMLNRMNELGCRTSPLICHTLVKGYLDCGQFEKACEVFEQAKVSLKESKLKPMYDTFALIIGAYAGRGNLKKTEELFSDCVRLKYHMDVTLYNALLRAHVKTKTFPHGITYRMRVDKIRPDAETDLLLSQLQQKV